LIPVLVVVMGGAALVSGSRGGVVALLAALLAMTLGSLAGSRSRQAARLMLASALIILAGIWIGGDVLFGAIERLVEEVGQPARSGRLQIWADGLRLWRETPMLGTGLASFGMAFPRVRTLKAAVTLSHAESDWVQLLIETGVLGLGLVITTGATLVFALLRRYRHADSCRARTLSLAGSVGVIGLALHGIVNYNVPVMSNFTYLAMTVTLAATDRSNRHAP
jgi:O-antigen ligase